MNIENLGLDIIHFERDENYLVNFNNESRLSFKNTNDNFPILIEGPGMAKFSDLNINGMKIEKGLIMDATFYTFFRNHTYKFLDTYVYAINNPVIDKEYKLQILFEFEAFLKTNPKELLIDKFIEDNPFLIELSLHLTNLHHQIKLDNLEEDFDQDLKPDVIAYRPMEKCWYIVDYKRAERELIKNSGKVRSGFYAEVNSLSYQLRNYLDYFIRSRTQSKHIKEKYGIDVRFPKGIGIIGTVGKEEEEELLKANRNLSKDMDVFPYNYLIDECRRVLEIQLS